MKKVLIALATALAVAFLVWISISFIQIILHNCDGASGEAFVYPAWNIIARVLL